ncbi:MAG: hypothetical protein WAZ77_14040 [Candidatus Nitrosopolaris sp.]|jgi:hypothetical protein
MNNRDKHLLMQPIICSHPIYGVLSIAGRISKETKKDGALVSIGRTISRGTSKRIRKMACK